MDDVVRDHFGAAAEGILRQVKVALAS